MRALFLLAMLAGGALGGCSSQVEPADCRWCPTPSGRLNCQTEYALDLIRRDPKGGFAWVHRNVPDPEQQDRVWLDVALAAATCQQTCDQIRSSAAHAVCDETLQRPWVAHHFEACDRL